jgi:hypothetical protein
MVMTKRQKSQIAEEHKELVDKLQVDARTLFYNKMMYEVNDSLTSILAICDIEAQKSIPKIKEYINRINESLNNTKNYQSSTCAINTFDITLVLKNLVRVIKENYKELDVIHFISDIKAPAKGDQSQFEQLFLNLFVLLFLNDADSEIMIELKQRDQDAMITIVKNPCSFAEESLEEIDKMNQEESFKGSIRAMPSGGGVEAIIKVPLQFKIVKIEKPIMKNATLKSDDSISQKPKKSAKKPVTHYKDDSMDSMGYEDSGLAAEYID